MYIYPTIIFSFIVLYILKKIKINNIKKCIIFFLYFFFSISFTLILIRNNITNQYFEKKIVLGKIINVYHKEEFKECISQSYSIYHPSINYIKTSNNKLIQVKTSYDNKILFNDNIPNNSEELKKYWKIGLPTAATNLYKSNIPLVLDKNVDYKNYYNKLPKYPSIYNYICLNKIVGEIPNGEKARKKLNELNANISIKENKDVNIIFVNLGDKPKVYGYALEQKWNRGNINDYIISFSLDKKGYIKWVYPFSWSNCKLLDTKIQELFLKNKHIKDFVPIVEDSIKLIDQIYNKRTFSNIDYLRFQKFKSSYFVIINLFNMLLVSVLYYINIKSK